MCGIAGYFGTTSIPAERVEQCKGLLRRRGPDAQASYRRTADSHHVCLVHGRLSIIDIDERANQPFRDQSLLLVYNGEVYNYRELREELKRAAGERFATESDTEVLLRVLRRDGWRGLDRCEGMWAFALYDEAENRLLLGRDRFGEKPLYYWHADGGIYFGSEVKFLAALAGRMPPVNLDQLFRYMVNGYKSLYKNGHTFFDGVAEVPPGCVLEIDASGCERTERYWSPCVDEVDPELSYEAAVAQIRKALIRAVELRLRADVPLAFCLSGGVDSNALIAIAKRMFGYDVHGFTIMNTDARYEERDMVEHSVAELGLRHTGVDIDKTEFLENLRTLIRQHDAPVYTITYYVQWQLMKAVAAEGYRVSISGTGADELFSGYYDHHNAYIYEVRNLAERRVTALAEWQEFVEPLVRNPYLRDPELFVRNPDERRHIYLQADEFATYLKHPWSEAFAETRYSSSLLRNRMLNELFHEAVPPILHEDDLNAMYYSIENRSPFLDRALFETMARVPTQHLVRRGRAKALLRDAVRGIAPDRIIDNPRKVGFNAPMLDLLNPSDPDVRRDILDPTSPIYEHVRLERIEALLDRAALPNSESKFLFYFLNAKLFLEELAN